MTWLKRNKWGLILLLPALILALLGSSFYLVRIYLPWYSDRTVQVEGSVEIPSSRTIVEYPNGEEYSAILTPVALIPVREPVVPERSSNYYFGPLEAAPGVTLWQLRTRVEADPNMVLGECELALVGESGALYTTDGGKLVDGTPTSDPFGGGCTLSLQPGPSMNTDNTVLPAEPDQERPAIYAIDTFIAVPNTDEPTAIRVSVGEAPSWTVAAPGK